MWQQGFTLALALHLTDSLDPPEESSRAASVITKQKWTEPAVRRKPRVCNKAAASLNSQVHAYYPAPEFLGMGPVGCDACIILGN